MVIFKYRKKGPEMVDINNEKASINHDQLQLPGQMNLSSQSISIFFFPLYFFQFRTMVIESSFSCKYHDRWESNLKNGVHRGPIGAGSM